MHRKRPRVAEWGRPNLVHNVKEKLFEAILKDGVIRLAKNQTSEPRSTQNLNQVQGQSKNNSKMMLKNECLCIFSLRCSLENDLLLFNSCSNGGMET